MPVDEERASRLKSEQARDELNRQIIHPMADTPTAPAPTGNTRDYRDRPSYFKDPSTKDGQLRWD